LKVGDSRTQQCFSSATNEGFTRFLVAVVCLLQNLAEV
jgi:hypothetical protein